MKRVDPERQSATPLEGRFGLVRLRRDGHVDGGGLLQPPHRRGRVDPRMVLIVASLGVFMAFVDDTVVGIAFPNLVRSFPHATLAELSWVLNAYNIAFAALMVPAGRFADVVGRRRMYLVGIVVFTLGSAVCAAAPTIGTLIGARALQGLGAAILVPASLAIVLHGAPGGRRAQSVAIWSATAALAAGVGPAIGGLLVDVYNWRLVFLVNLPIGALTWYFAGRELVESRAPGRRLLPDLRGAALLALAVGALSLGIVEGPNWGWASPAVIAAFAASGASAVVLARRCLTHPAPVLDLELLRAPGFTITSGLTVIGAAGFFALGLTNLLFMMQVWRYSPLQTGLAITPAPFLAALVAGLAGRLARRFDARRLVVVGAAIWAVGPLILLARMGSRARLSRRISSGGRGPRHRDRLGVSARERCRGGDRSARPIRRRLGAQRRDPADRRGRRRRDLGRHPRILGPLGLRHSVSRRVVVRGRVLRCRGHRRARAEAVSQSGPGRGAGTRPAP